MLEVGLTGGIATGKSSVALLFKDLGAPVVDTDQLAREVVEKGSEALAEIVAVYGDKVLGPDGSLDRRSLREHIFSDQAARSKLESIVHPRVAALVDRDLTRLDQTGSHSVVLVDVPLLYEAGWDKRFPEVVLVYVPARIQIERLMARDGLDSAQAKQALSAQMPIEQKRNRAKFLIDNGGSLEETRRQVLTVWKRLQEMAVNH